MLNFTEKLLKTKKLNSHGRQQQLIKEVQHKEIKMKRYKYDDHIDCYGDMPYMLQCDDGEYVKYEDVEKLRDGIVNIHTITTHILSLFLQPNTAFCEIDDICEELLK